jgi:hypothetical protein
MSEVDLSNIYAVDTEWTGDLIGYYCLGHVDKELFYRVAYNEYEEMAIELYEYGSVEDKDYRPFDVTRVKHLWYRLPTEEELEDGDYVEREFVFSKNFEDGLNPITYMDFED